MQDRYQIQEEINQGGVGVVLKAWDTRLQRTVAIKRFLAPELRSDGGAIDPDLMKEATVLSAMQHPNIVSIYDVLPDEPEGPCVVMEYLNGKDLEQAVSEAAMTLDDFYKVANQTLDALNNAHQLNLLHRDIKPANIQVNWLANGNFICKFVDFGLARFFEKPSRQTVRPDGTVMGSVYYMAPEQLERLPLDGRADLYSLGCVFYYLLSMHRPFEGATLQEIIHGHLSGTARPLKEFRPQLPPALCQWVHWLMQRQPHQRPGDAGQALAALQNIQRGQSSASLLTRLPARTGKTPSPTAKSKAKGKSKPAVLHRRPTRKKPLTWLIPTATAAALTLLAAFTWQRWNAPSHIPTRTAASIIAAAREAEKHVNATAQPEKIKANANAREKNPIATIK